MTIKQLKIQNPKAVQSSKEWPSNKLHSEKEEGVIENRWENSHHSSKHATKAPHIQGIVIVLQIDKKFRPLEVSD